MNQSIPTIKHFVALIVFNQFDEKLNSINQWALQIIKELKLKVVKKTYYRFQPIGVTFCFFLSQSHLVIHTYPENNLLHIDLSVCKDIEKTHFSKAIKKTFAFLEIKKIVIKEIKYR